MDKKIDINGLASYYVNLFAVGEKLLTVLESEGFDVTPPDVSEMCVNPRKIQISPNGAIVILIEGGIPLEFITPLGTVPILMGVRFNGDPARLLKKFKYLLKLKKMNGVGEADWGIYYMRENGGGAPLCKPKLLVDEASQMNPEEAVQIWIDVKPNRQIFPKKRPLTYGLTS